MNHSTAIIIKEKGVLRAFLLKLLVLRDKPPGLIMR